MDIRLSEFLIELISYSTTTGGNPGIGYTAEKLIISLIDEPEPDIFGFYYEEFNSAIEILKKAIPDFSYACRVLKEHVAGTGELSCDLDKVYAENILIEARMKCEESGESCLTVPRFIECIIEDPSEAIKKVLAQQYKEADMGDIDISDILFYDDDDLIDELLKPDYSDNEGEQDTEAARDEMAKLIGEVKSLRSHLKSRVLGQENAINVFATGYFRAGMLSMTDRTRRRPKATFLFAGPPGVGKTYLAETVAEALGMKNKFKIFDMSEYCDKEASIEFCGSDSVYKNSKSGNFTAFVSENPECVVLFDEIEKAHISIIHLFLQILDAGRIRDSNTNKEISLKNAILIFTTNAGKQLYEDTDMADLSLLSRKVVLNALRHDINPQTGVPYFPGAICSRFASGNVVMFNHIKPHDLLRIAKEEILRHTGNIKARTGLDIKIDEEVYSALLFAEGGHVDARTIRSRAESFINDELYELLRFVETDKVNTSIGNIDNIKISVNLGDAAREIKALFKNEVSCNILVLAGEDTVSDIKSRLVGCEIIGVKTADEAIEAVKKGSVDIAMLDLSYNAAENTAHVLNIEDIASPARDFFGFITEQRSNLPVFLLENQSGEITEEEEESFFKRGIRGVLKMPDEDFANRVYTIVTDIHRQVSLRNLATANKLVTFETSQTVSEDGKSAEITLFDFKLTVAVDSEDAKSILSDISRPDVSFDDVIGAKDAKSELSYFVSYLKNPSKYLGTGVKAPRGVILYGPAGTGKTMLAKAMAAEAGVTFIAAEGNRFLKKYVGEGPETVHSLFRTARKYAPSILFVDEIDAIAKERRGGVNASANGEDILTAFLAEMDGFSSDPSRPVFVLAATNFSVESGSVRSLDASFIRRFDRSVFIDLPDKEERITFLNKRLSKNPALEISAGEIDNISVRSTGMSLAQLDSVIELALRSAIREGSTVVTDAIFEKAFETFNSGEEKKWDSSQLERVARHEAGHALLCWLGGEAPSYVTVVARADHGGYMQHGDNEGKQIYTMDELLARIRTSLGGRAAEIAYYGKRNGLSTGAGADLANATNIARQLVCNYGMDEEFGLAVVQKADGDNEMSDKVRASVNRILKEQMDKAVELVTENMGKIDALVNVLMTKNHLNGYEIEKVFKDE